MIRTQPLPTTPGRIKGLSWVSSVSLLVFGTASFLVALPALEVSGLLVGLALALHGYYEFCQRRRLLVRGEGGSCRRLALNQLLLAVSVCLYLLWQYAHTRGEAIMALLNRDPIKSVLDELPVELAFQLRETLSNLIPVSYLVASVVVVVGCVGMAAMYRRAGRSLEGVDR